MSPSSDAAGGTSVGVSILAGGRAGQQVEQLLSDLFPERGTAAFDEVLLVVPGSDERAFST